MLRRRRARVLENSPSCRGCHKWHRAAAFLISPLARGVSVFFTGTMVRRAGVHALFDFLPGLESAFFSRKCMNLGRERRGYRLLCEGHISRRRVSHAYTQLSFDFSGSFDFQIERISMTKSV